MSETDSKIVYRKDYKPFPYSVDSVDLDFVLDAESTLVTTTMRVRPKSGFSPSSLHLDADELAFERLFINGVEVDDTHYTLTSSALIVRGVTAPARITIINRFSPARNTALSGIYMSHGAFMSQCESQGFRRITYWPDRPDVMSRFTVTIHADKAACPILLSNGNLVASGEEANGRHWVKFVDPYKKPSYLFALVAGDFKDRSEDFTLKDGRVSHLSIWTEPHNYAKSAHALESLKKAIRWDEERFGLELDLDRFGIVATDDFNFGAMENKSLNIFNSRYVMATPDMATDTDYDRIESVVGHEYFHNWTGDRVTVRDWFQITLKEGLTVFRDQEFSMDMAPDAASRAVRRILDVRALRQAQFPEDAGPMAHPIRPESYREVDNFYTMTVYEKGAEVVRMLQTILGKDGFKKGLTNYLARFDGQAVTCDDFLAAFTEVCGVDLTQFARWYSQAGTPRVRVRTVFDPVAKTCTVFAYQTTTPTPGQPEKEPFVIPITLGLIGNAGKDLPLQLAGEEEPSGHSRTLILAKESDEWVFTHIEENPIISIGRGFSAPVIFEYPYTREELSFLALNDSDLFNRAEAMRVLVNSSLAEMIDEVERGEEPVIPEIWVRTFGAILKDTRLSPAFRACALTMPEETSVAQERVMINPEAIHKAVMASREALGNRFAQDLAMTAQAQTVTGPYRPDAEQAGKRALKNLALDYWLAGGSAKALLDVREQFEKADNLTDRLAALTSIVCSRSPAKADVLNAAAKLWYKEPLLLNKWFTVQALAPSFKDELPVLDRIRALMGYDVFSIKNPNNVYALVGAFLNRNPAEFHRADGLGYEFWADTVLQLDSINTHVASRMARALDHWRRYEPHRAKLMNKALTRVAACSTLSPAVREIVEKALTHY